MKRSELKDSLELVGLALADKPLIPTLQCFCFEKGLVKAYDDQIGIIADCPVTVEFAVHGKTFLGLLKTSNAENLEFNLGDNEVTIKADRSTFKLPFLPAEDFLFKDFDCVVKARIKLNEALLEGLKACLTTTSRDQAQPALMGVYLSPGYFFGCDGDVVTKAEVGSVMSEPHSCLMPNAFCHAVLQISETTKCTEGVLEISDDWAVVGFANEYEVYGRLIQNDNPIDFDDLINKTIKGKITFVEVPPGLNEALARARVIADTETVATVFTIEANRLKLLTDGRAGVVRDSLGIAKHPDVKVSLSAEMVQKTISLCDEICVMENCLVGRKGTQLLQVVSTMDTGK